MNQRTPEEIRETLDGGYTVPATAETLNSLSGPVRYFYERRWKMHRILPSELAARCLLNEQGGVNSKSLLPEPAPRKSRAGRPRSLRVFHEGFSGIGPRLTPSQADALRGSVLPIPPQGATHDVRSHTATAG